MWGLFRLLNLGANVTYNYALEIEIRTNIILLGEVYETWGPRKRSTVGKFRYREDTNEACLPKILACVLEAPT
jgi:hypothetical protein